MPKEFYLEIGSEEIPAGYIVPALSSLASQMTRLLDDHHIAHGKPFTTATPRRLVLTIPEVAPQQEAFTTEIVGPPRLVGYDEEGRPTKAAEGFARGQGVSVADISIKETPKGEYLCIVRQESGQSTKDLLEKQLPDIIAHIPFPKSMRWGSLSVTFARPLHCLVALLDGEVLDFQYGDVRSGNQSIGHRFMSPAPITVTDYRTHRENLRQHAVIIDREERKEHIRQGIAAAAAKVGGKILANEDLLDEVTQLVEYPEPLLGEFEEKYLQLPPELLITVIKKHQRYFAVTDEQGNLLRYFVTVANTKPRDPGLVAAGNARVVRARLEDARFYYEEDQKVPLEVRAEQLRGVVFHSKLGTSWEKVGRFTAVSRWLGNRLAPDKLDTLLRAAFLCKADLVTGMVGEFPELQGVMGRAYARLQGEPEAVAQAIYEHYLPTHAGGAVPRSMEGALLSIADKIDTIVGCFGVGLIPTGTADPFALRRQTLGILRIILETPLHLSLSDLVDQTLPLLAAQMTEPALTTKQGVQEFFQGRLQHWLVNEEGYAADVVEAALSAGIDDVVDAVARLQALARFKTRPDFDSLALTFKRVVNIIKEPQNTPVATDLFNNPAEQALFDALQQTEDVVQEQIQQADYDAALAAMAKLKKAVDQFFDSVLVMDKFEAVRRNRLAMLTRIQDLFVRVADFKKIQTN